MTTKIGFGYDVHRLEKGRKLMLGGVDVPFDKGLNGHSDADVLLHAICDALLGALGLGDIGEHFPNTDEQYHNISSLVLLEKVSALVKSKGYQVGNVDCMIVTEEPKLKNYKSQMADNIARLLSLDSSEINIKAGTNEGMGFIGQKEGMAAYASVLLNSS